MAGTVHQPHNLTPFLLPAWSDEERYVLDEWLAGASFQPALPELEQTVTRDFGHGWTARLLNLGRSALQVVLEAMNLDDGDEVILPSLICTGVAAAVIRAGARPVFADVDEQFNLRLESVLEATSPRVRAVVMPHMAGLWARDTCAVAEWARSAGVYVVEDCAQAQGLVADGMVAGTLGDAAIFSSHGSKILAGSGGGWVVTRHPQLAEAIGERSLAPEPRSSAHLRLETFARDCTGAPATLARFAATPNIGHPAAIRATPREMSDIEAKLLLLQWEKVPEIIQRRGVNASRWRDLLESLRIPGLRLPPAERNIFCKMLLSFEEREDNADGSRHLRRALLSSGVETEDWYSPLHLRAPFNRFRRTPMPVTERLWRQAFSVPIRPNLTSLDWQRIESAVSSLVS